MKNCKTETVAASLLLPLSFFVFLSLFSLNSHAKDASRPTVQNENETESEQQQQKRLQQPGRAEKRNGKNKIDSDNSEEKTAPKENENPPGTIDDRAFYTAIAGSASDSVSTESLED